MRLLESEQSFIAFMVKNGPGKEKSRLNYISWLRYIELQYGSINNLTETRMNFMLDDLIETSSSREIYSKKTDISNFQSAMRKYLKFISSQRNK